jgi:hypothetical protein
MMGTLLGEEKKGTVFLGAKPCLLFFAAAKKHHLLGADSEIY